MFNQISFLLKQIHHLQDSSWITSITPRQSGLVPLFDPWASLTSFNGPSIHLRHSLGKTEPRFFCASPGLVYPPSMFLVEPFPCLCSTPLSPKPMLAPEELSTKEECFSLCRWLLSQDVPLRSATCLVQYVIQEWQFVSNAIQFQQETTRWKQIRTLRNFFGLVAAVILSTYDQPSDPTSFEVRTLQRLLESSLDSSHDSGSMQMASSTKRRRLASSTEDRDSTSTCGTVKAAFEFLLSSNRKDGCLWWLVLDWTVRLKWQRMVSAHPENSTHSMFPWLHDLLDVAVPYMNVMKTLADPRPSWPDPSYDAGPDNTSLSKTAAHNLDRLAYEVLTELVLFSKSAERLEWATQLRSRFISDVERLLCREAWPIQSLPMRIHLPSWRVRFLLVTGLVLRECHLCSLSNYVPDWPLGLRTNPSLAFFVYQYVNEKHRVLSLMSEDQSKWGPLDNLSTLLTGLYWSSNFVLSRSCASSEQLLAPSCCLSDQQSCETIDFLLNMLHDTPKPKSNSGEFAFKRLRTHLDLVRLQLERLRADRAPQSILAALNVPTSSNLHQLLTATWDRLIPVLSKPVLRPDLHNLRCAMQLLLEYATRRDRLQSEQINQFMSILHRAVPSSLRKESSTPHPVDDTYYPLVCTDLYDLRIDGGGHRSIIGLDAKRDQLLHLNRLELFGSLLRFASRTGDSELITHMQKALADEISQGSCGDTVESVEWYCVLIRMVHRAFSSINPVDFCGMEEVYTTFVSFLVDTLREAFKSRLARGSSLPNVVHLIYLMQTYCQLVDCVCLLVERVKSKFPSRHWSVIGCHLDQLCKTVWAICARRSSGFLVGLEFCSGECLHAWMKLRAFELTDRDSTPDHCLNSLLYYRSAPAVLLRFTEFLQNLASKLEDANWNRKHAAAVLQLIDSVLRLLSVRQLRIEPPEEMEVGATADECPDQFALCLCSYRLLLTCLVRLPDLPPATDTKVELGENLSIGRPRVEHLAELCAQLIKCVPGPSAPVYGTQCASVNAALPSISQNPVQLVRVIEQILRSIAFHHPNVQCDKRRVCSINPLFYSCLASLASLVDPSCAPNVSINQGSLEQRNVQAAKELFSSIADFTSLVEQLFALGATLAPKSDAPDVHTSLIMPHCMRFASWIALSDLIAQCVFDVNFPQPCPMQLKDFVFWRLIIGHLTLLTAELQSEFLHILEILASLKRILTISQCHIDPSRDIQMETSLHHSLVAHLVWTALITFQHPEPKSLWGVTVRKQVSEALMLLISQERFQKAVCELPSFPRSDRITHGFIVETLFEEMNSYFASFQTELEIVCSCQRTPLVQEIILLTRYFDPIEIHRCVTSRRFQGPILMALNRRLSDYLALNPCSIGELESRISQCGQVDHPSLIKDENSPELILSAALLIGQLQDLLQPASSSRQLSVESVLIGSMDTVTYEAGLLCLDSLQRLLTFGRSVSPSPPCLRRDISDHILYDDLDPQVVRIWQCLIYLGQSAANCVSSESLFSAQVLHNTSRHCGLSLTSLLAPIEENENFLADTSLHCILWPYLSSVDRKKDLVVLDPEKNCAHQRIACMNSEDQFIAEWNELLLACASPTHSPSDILVSMSNLILWWVNLPVILNPICLCLKPALRKSPSLYYDIFPWLVVTALTQDNTFGRDCSLSFSRALVKCVQLGMLNEQVDSGVRHLFLDALMSFHHWKQWKTLRCTKSAMAIDVTVDWLQAAQCAITLCRPNDARLCFELAWLHQGCPSDWFISTPEAREMWLGLSRLSCDLPGLQAAQIEFLSSDSTPIMSTTVATLKPLSLIDQAKLAANELLGDWGRLLVYHDRLLQTDRSYFLNPQIARCLNQMGARNLLTQLVLSDLRRMDSFDPRADSGISEPGLRGSDVSEIQEMRVAIAWRLGQWESYGASNSSSSHCSIPVYDTDQLELPTCSWSECGSQTVFYWLCHAADRADWAHVLTILSQQRSRYLCLKNGTSRRRTALPVHDILMSSQQFACVTALQRMCSRIVKLYQSNERSTTLASKILPMLCQVADYTNCSSNESPLTRGGKRVQRQLLCDATQSLEPLATVTLRLITSMLSTRNSQLRNSEGPFAERARLFGLVRLIRLLTVSFAVKTGAVQQAEDLLVDASRSPGFADLANLVDSSKPDVCRVTQCWYQLRTVELSALIERVRGEYCVATSHLQIALQDAEKVLSGLPTACPVSLTQGLVRCYLHGVTTLCNWLFESRTKSAADLLTNHLEPAIQLAKRLAIGVDANAWASLARFADAQFTALDSYLSSSEFAARRQLLVEAQSDVTCLTDLGEKSRLLRMLQRQSAIELEEMETIQSDADRYMQLAVDSYAHCLSSSDTYDLKLVKRLIDEHPHHTAFTLLFLVNAKLDNVYNPHPTGQSLASAAPRSSASRARGGRGSGIQTEVLDGGQTGSEENGRILAARRIFDQLSQGRQGKLLRQMQLLAEAYVEWANADVEKYRNRPGDVPLPADCKLSRFVVSARARGASSGPSDLLDLVAVPTVNLAVNRSGLYPPSSVVRVTGFVPQFRLAGGINVPKIITCLGTDGRQRRQLVKGRDDPRQDAVMQQVFSAANCLLQRGRRESTDLGSTDNSTFSIHKQSWLYSDGGLRMRTYKVLPMAERSGVIEWCEGTIPLGEWLAADRVGAHQRYRPRDMTPAEAKQRLAAVRDRPPERRRVVFEEIMGRLKPVMAYFYLEQFPDSRGWCLARSAYTRSLAVSSLVGYLVGLGDRHPQNILLHQGSGELVHIDLGVAFDQGRLLPTPEMVPFRLTRDLVHALGPLGLQAGFTPAAEVVLAALRTGSDVILTLLQVLLHDPLYSWSLSPAQLCALEARRAELLQTSGFQASKSSCGTILLDQTNFPGDNVRDKDRLNVTKTILGSTTSVLNTTFTGRTGPGKTREPVNQLAERVLIGVRSKLEGRVTGNLASSSDGNPARCGGLDQLDVAGHVGLLVRAATDPANLSRMYFGWQAYL
ncbi:ATM serine/threonine kinase [Fasciola hepatica]|uniref:non-specific serine/threonine protein kinase n=1 Tax=Fasciola hepatica TaxID=6192 RepID=A0A4E0RE66_FASHE|nr:ATM serine/threonine kinase [Fasciola hepatica]